MRNIHLVPFRVAVKEAHVGGVMAAYSIWLARGHRFDFDILHSDNQFFNKIHKAFFLSDKTLIKQKAV
jgi:hypothetical protein